MLSSILTWLAIFLINVLKTNCIMEGHIVHGDYVSDIRSFPHAVYLILDCGGVFTCGSSVINQRILITAAHCLETCERGFKIQCIAGSTNVDEAEVEKRAASFIMHSDYDEHTCIADIALIMLNGDLPLGPKIKRVIIKPNFPVYPEKPEIAGWGVINENFKATNKLKHIQQKVWKIEMCNRYRNMLRGMFCAVSDDGGYPYRGDSGSGLVTKDYQLIGLVSFRGKNKKDLITYTNVSYYYSWIDFYTKKLYCG